MEEEVEETEKGSTRVDGDDVKEEDEEGEKVVEGEISR